VPAKQDDLITKLISTVSDLIRQVSRYLPISLNALERHNRAYEELDSIRLSLEEQRELLSDHFQENSRWADALSKRIDRLERYMILSRMVGGSQDTLQIESSVSKEHIERALREELVNQQQLVIQYQKNINIIKQRIAKSGESVISLNELEEYQSKLDKALEAMERIREQLNESTS